MKKRYLGVVSFLLIAFLVINGIVEQDFSKAEEPPVEAWGEADFTFEGSTVTGFSEQGLKKALAMGNNYVLKFPEKAEFIGGEAFHINKLTAESLGENKLPEGITGSVEFHGKMRGVGSHAFQGNTKITGVTVFNAESDAYKSFAFHIESFIPVPEYMDEGEGNKQRGWLNTNGNYLKGKPQGSLSQLVLGKREYDFQARCFALANLSSVNFSNALGGRIEEFSFSKSGIRNIESFGNIWWLNSGAFAFNQIEMLQIPTTVQNIRFHAFYKNKTLKSLTFDPGRTGSVQIDRDAFNGCALEGHLEFPVEFGNEMGGRSFANNNLTEVTFSDKTMLNGYYSFQNNPLVSIYKFNPSVQAEGGVFKDTKTLKNVSYVYSNQPNRLTEVKSEVFLNGKLRSINIPDYISAVDVSSFRSNTGWYPAGDNSSDANKKKVALYRVKEDGTYNTDNSLQDGEHYIVNPVLVKARMIDENGADLGAINLEGGRVRGAEELGVKIDGENYLDFKIGDSFRFTAPVKDGYELLEVGADGVMTTPGAGYTQPLSIHFTKENVREEKYHTIESGYKVGYKEATILLRYKNLKPAPVKVKVKTNFVDENGADLSKSANVDGKRKRVGVEDKSVSIVNKENDTDFLLDDTFEFTIPKIEGYTVLGVEGKGIAALDASNVTKPYSLSLKEENLNTLLTTSDKEAVFTLKYKKNVPYIPPYIPDLNPTPNPDPTPTPNPGPNPTPDPTEKEEVIPVDEDSTPKSEAKILPKEEKKEEPKNKIEKNVEEDLDIEADEVPQGKANVKKEKGKTLAKTGGLQTHFIPALLSLGSLLLLVGILQGMRRKKDNLY